MKRPVRNLIMTISPLVAFPSWVGLVTSAAVGIALYQLVPRLTAMESRKAQKVATADLMAVLEGLTLCLSAGLSIPESMKWVAESRSTLAHRQLFGALQVYELGQDLPTALGGLERLDSQWALMCRILSSAHLSGAPVVAAFDSLLEYLHEEEQSEIATRIRALAVKSVLPLGLCFLPAFLLLTVVPLIAQFISQIDW